VATRTDSSSSMIEIIGGEDTAKYLETEIPARRCVAASSSI